MVICSEIVTRACEIIIGNRKIKDPVTFHLQTGGTAKDRDGVILEQ